MFCLIGRRDKDDAKSKGLMPSRNYWSDGTVASPPEKAPSKVTVLARDDSTAEFMPNVMVHALNTAGLGKRL